MFSDCESSTHAVAFYNVNKFQDLKESKPKKTKKKKQTQSVTFTVQTFLTKLITQFKSKKKRCDDGPVVCCGDCLAVCSVSEDLHLCRCRLNALEFHLHASPQHFLKAAQINKVSLRRVFCYQHVFAHSTVTSSI